ncbi:MAG: prepilin-type N-terminal cleavage/methylation domain-containing protein [Luteolibacter sp.]|nr:prepilin-type N-terminal cleavage/methylation domain-containing protein [Luteolibacter sp.]
MKIPNSRRRYHGFTLVELLVVIAIIAVLASAGFAAGGAAIQKARKTTALATAVALETAVNNFYTEYGSMPKDGDQDTVTVKTDTDLDVLKALLGMEGTGTGVLNTRAIKFLSVREGKKKGTGGVNGLVYSGTGGTSIQGLYDPWGGPFYLAMDLNYDERITVQPKMGGSTILNGRRAAVWSNGADATGLPGSTGTGKATDDVKTWGQ